MSAPADAKSSSDKVSGKTKLSKLDQAAILLLSLGEEDAAAVLKHLGPKEVQRVGSAMTSLKNVQTTDVEVVLNEFVGQASRLTGLGVSSDNYIRKMLVTALGEDKANGLVDRILLGGNTTGLDTLKWMDARSVAELIKNEHPQIQAIVIAYLDPDHAAGVLACFPDAVRLEVMMRVASLDAIQPNALQELNDVIEKQFTGNATSQQKTMGGFRVAAEIMNQLETAVSDKLMKAINDQDADVGTRITDLMFVFEDLKEIDDRGIQVLMREVASDQLILALKGADDSFKEKIFKNMSKRAAELLRDDLASKGPVKVTDVEAAQKAILVIARRLSDAGEIMLGGAGAEAMI